MAGVGVRGLGKAQVGAKITQPLPTNEERNEETNTPRRLREVTPSGQPQRMRDHGGTAKKLALDGAGGAGGVGRGARGVLAFFCVSYFQRERPVTWASLTHCSIPMFLTRSCRQPTGSCESDRGATQQPTSRGLSRRLEHLSSMIPRPVPSKNGAERRFRVPSCGSVLCSRRVPSGSLVASSFWPLSGRLCSSHCSLDANALPHSNQHPARLPPTVPAAGRTRHASELVSQSHIRETRRQREKKKRVWPIVSTAAHVLKRRSTSSRIHPKPPAPAPRLEKKHLLRLFGDSWSVCRHFHR